MSMLLEKKITEIRQQPESVRIRYVFGSVSIVMAVLFLFWVMTLRAGFRSADSSGTQALDRSIPDSVKALTEEATSIRDMVGDTGSALREGMGDAVGSGK